MNRRALRSIGLLVTLAFGLLVVPLEADAQHGRNLPQIGLLITGPWAARSHLVEAFRQGLRELGYVEGQNIALVWRSAEGISERLPDLAAELVRLPVDIIVAIAAPAAQAAKLSTHTVPIVMLAGDALGSGLVASLARPGGNITGLSLMSPDHVRKRFELLKEVVPGLARVAVLWNPANPAKGPEWREMQVAARASGVRLDSREVRAFEDVERAFAAMMQERPDALIVTEDPLTVTHRTEIVAFAAKARLLAIYTFREFTDAGGLMAYGPNQLDHWRRLAVYVDKILKGAKPADLPVEQPTTFELVINLKTAQALGLTIPPTLLFQADEVIR
jgi:putative tryptophan/tyrosine transport system substrate-binding protein